MCAVANGNVPTQSGILSLGNPYGIEFDVVYFCLYVDRNEEIQQQRGKKFTPLSLSFSYSNRRALNCFVTIETH